MIVISTMIMQTNATIMIQDRCYCRVDAWLVVACAPTVGHGITMDGNVNQPVASSQDCQIVAGCRRNGIGKTGYSLEATMRARCRLPLFWGFLGILFWWVEPSIRSNQFTGNRLNRGRQITFSFACSLLQKQPYQIQILQCLGLRVKAPAASGWGSQQIGTVACIIMSYIRGKSPLKLCSMHPCPGSFTTDAFQVLRIN